MEFETEPERNVKCWEKIHFHKIIDFDKNINMSQ